MPSDEGQVGRYRTAELQAPRGVWGGVMSVQPKRGSESETEHATEQSATPSSFRWSRRPEMRARERTFSLGAEVVSTILISC
jgi:hypothetical protein